MFAMGVYLLWLQTERQHTLLYTLQSNLITLQKSIDTLEKNNLDIKNRFETLEAENKNLKNELEKYEKKIQNEKNKEEIKVIIPKSQRDFSTIIKKENNNIMYDKNLSLPAENNDDEYKIVPEVFIDKEKQKIDGLKINVETTFETGK